MLTRIDVSLNYVFLSKLESMWKSIRKSVKEIMAGMLAPVECTPGCASIQFNGVKTLAGWEADELIALSESQLL